MNVTEKDILKALSELRITDGDLLLVHSSLKSMGYVQGGAETVIDAFTQALGRDGTLVMPAFAQEDFGNAYKTWHIDKPSETGYITEVFRKSEQVLRSDQATHSVCARGKLARYLTENHGAYGRRPGAFGDTPFARCSPWQKMFELNAKIIFLGVTQNSNTSKHLTEYILIEEALEKIQNDERREEMKNRLRSPERLLDTSLVWPFFEPALYEALYEERNLISRTACGNAVLTEFKFASTTVELYDDVKKNPQKWYTKEMLEWLKECEK